MAAIERTDHLTELVTETIDAADAKPSHCIECGGTGYSNRLFVFYTVRGNRSRRHDGAFCSKQCHDIYHGLAPRKSN